MKSMGAAEVLEYRSKMSENVVKEFGPVCTL